MAGLRWLFVLVLSLCITLLKSTSAPALLHLVQSFFTINVESLMSLHILSHDPSIIYIEDFISSREISHLLAMSSMDFKRSKIVLENGSWVDSPYRTSSTAWLPANDTVVAEIKSRAAELQGFSPIDEFENLQLTRYRPNEEYKPHFDWFDKPAMQLNRTHNRETTIFATLEATCDRCGTRFPGIRVDWTKESPKWCRFVDCEDLNGLTFRAIPGNAIFWRNLNQDRTGDTRMLHAGLPPEQGIKTGLNIWKQCIV